MLTSNKIDYEQYHKDYYNAHKLDYTQFVKCECCNVFVKGYSLNKHNKGKRHIFNTLSDDEKTKLLQQKTEEFQQKHFYQI